MMKIKGTMIFKSIRKAVVLLLALFVVLLISSCSPETLELCRVGISTEETTRNLTATLSDPLNTYKVYYRSIYKGKGVSYGDMSKSNSYNLLDSSSGILISQGLWEIEVIFRNASESSSSTYTPSDISTEIHGTSGVVYINLNTTQITVSVDSSNSTEKGIITVNYSLKRIPATNLDLNNPLKVDFYSYNNGSFNKIYSSVSLSNNGYVFTGTLNNIDSGVYFAVFTVTGTVFRETGIISVDTIGFVVRPGLTTEITGECTHTFKPSTNTFDVIHSSNSSSSSNSSDIRNFYGSDFKNDGIYTISQDADYNFIPEKQEDGTMPPSNKELTSGQKVTIDMNGKSIINCNSSTSQKTTFTVDNGASLTIYNSEKGKDSQYIGYSGTAPDAAKQASFVVNGGTFTLGSTDASNTGSIKLKGAPADMNSSGVKNGPIEFTTNGGIINILSPGIYGYDEDNKPLVAFTRIENCTSGITNLHDNSMKNNGDTMDLTINMKNSSINAKGDSNDTETGIYINGLKDKTTNYKGKININLDGVSDQGFTIKCDNDKNSSGYDHSCIVIENYSGTINITLTNNAYLISKKGNGIYLKNCSGPINITISNGSTIYGYEGSGNGIVFDNCKQITVTNNGTGNLSKQSAKVKDIVLLNNSTITSITGASY